MLVVFMGKVVEKIGFRLMGIIVSFFYGIGIIMIGWVIY